MIKLNERNIRVIRMLTERLQNSISSLDKEPEFINSVFRENLSHLFDFCWYGNSREFSSKKGD